MPVMSALRAIYRPTVMQWAVSGMSASAISRKLKVDFGQSYRWQDLLRDVRVASGRHLKQHLIESLSTYERPGVTRMVENRLKQPFRYRIIGQATVQDKLTGNFATRTVSVYTDVNYSAEEAEDYFIALQGQRSYTQDVNWVAFKPLSYEHNEGMSY